MTSQTGTDHQSTPRHQRSEAPTCRNHKRVTTNHRRFTRYGTLAAEGVGGGGRKGLRGGAYRGTGARGAGSRRGPPRFPSPPSQTPRGGSERSRQRRHCGRTGTPLRRQQQPSPTLSVWAVAAKVVERSLLVRFPMGNVAGTRSGRGDVSTRAGRGPLPRERLFPDRSDCEFGSV
jgi:hypothetical protein